MEALFRYEEYHQHPVNRLIHVACIPLIIWSSILLLMRFPKTLLLLLIYYISTYIFSGVPYGILSSILLIIIVAHATEYVKHNRNYIATAIQIQIIAWCMQFVGHAIEGSRPALMDSLQDAFLYAPVFVVNELMSLLI